MTQDTAPPPHPQTRRFTRTQIAIAVVAIVLTVIFGILNYSKPTGGNSQLQGTNFVSGGSAGVNNGTINNGPIYNTPTPPSPSGPAVPRAFEGGSGIPFENTDVRGVLKPANEQTPPNACDRVPGNPDALTALVGDNAFSRDGMGVFHVVKIEHCDALSIERKPEGVFINASLFDSESGAVVAIHDNRITAQNGETYIARQSRDESRLVVKNLRGAELFYIRYLNATTIQFHGFLGCAKGQAVEVREGQRINGSIIGHNCGRNAETGIQIGRQ